MIKAKALPHSQGSNSGYSDPILKCP